jgi:hypothetical protein
MSFSWLSAHVPASVKKTFPAAFLAMHRREIAERAGLLRRLGYTREQALRRCQAYDVWEYEPFHASPLAGEIAHIVDQVYKPQVGRVTTLSPGA